MTTRLLTAGSTVPQARTDSGTLWNRPPAGVEARLRGEERREPGRVGTPQPVPSGGLVGEERERGISQGKEAGNGTVTSRSTSQGLKFSVLGTDFSPEDFIGVILT